MYEDMILKILRQVEVLYPHSFTLSLKIVAILNEKYT